MKRHPRAPSPAVDRDRYTPKHPTPATGVPESFEDDVTGKYEGEELQRAREERAERNPARQIALLEADQKALGADVNAIKVSVAKIEGEQKATNTALTGISKTLDLLAQREHVTFTAKVEVDKAEKTAKVAVDQAERLDDIDARKVRRQLLLKVAGVATVGGALLGKILNWLGLL